MVRPQIPVNTGRSLFFYGTLCHRPLLDIVMGDADILVEEAVLADHAVHWVKDAHFPTIIAQSGAQAKGVIVAGLTEDHIARLNFYEGAFQYSLQQVTVKTSSKDMSVEMYFPPRDMFRLGMPWNLPDWVSRFGAVNSRAAREIMSHYGQVSQSSITKWFEQIHARAAAYERMQTLTISEGREDRASDISISDHRRPYSAFFALEEHDLQVRRFDGGQSEPMTRAGFASGDASIVLPYDPVRKHVLLVEQFRYGALIAGDRDPWSVEPIAGRIDLDETAEDAARREAVEEAGVTLTDLHTVARCYPSPGISNEFFHIFVGLCDLPDDCTGIGGKEDEHEDIKSSLMDLDRLSDQLDRHELRNGPLVMAAQWLLRHHEKLS